VQYTVFEHGRPIGESDLGFAMIAPGTRMGWFYPNALGETLMPVIGAVLSALRALARRDGDVHCTADSAAVDKWRESAEYADWREAMHHVEQLDLELRRADGTVVRTTQISIQDTEALLELARYERSAPSESPDDDIGCMRLDDELMDDEMPDDEIETDLVIPGEWENERVLDDWISPLHTEAEMGRYQIFVILDEDGAVS
jgi:hypothetical protein